jgi:hypothetical protein
MITREELLKWLETCPSHKWEIITGESDNTRILFHHEED